MSKIFSKVNQSKKKAVIEGQKTEMLKIFTKLNFDFLVFSNISNQSKSKSRPSFAQRLVTKM